MSIKSFFKECNKREVFKLLSIYIVSSWVILQVLSVIWQPLNLPEKSVTFLIVILLIGFPIYIYILWKSKVRHVKNSDEDETIESSIKSEIGFKRSYFVALGLITLVSLTASGLILKNNFFQGGIPILQASEKIAVLNFQNNTGDTTLDIVGKMTADWLIHGITENHAGEVISSEVVNNYSSLLGTQVSPKDNINILNKFLNPNKVISGAYFLNGNTLVLRCSIEEGSSGKTLFAFSPIECNSDSSLDCIENLRQQVVGYLVTKDKGELNLEDYPPKFEAYQKFQDAYAAVSDSKKHIKLLDESIALDSNFFEPKVWRVQHYYNEGEYRISDSLNKIIASNKRLSKRQQYLLNFTKALIDGKNDKVYRNYKHEYDIAPFHLESNATYLILLMQFINKPELVEEAFNIISMKDMNIENCAHCVYRYYMMGYAYNELNEYQKTIDLLEPIVSIIEDESLYYTLITAYIRQGNIDDLNSFISKLELLSKKADMSDMNLRISQDFLLVNDSTSAGQFFNKITNSNSASDLNKANAYYYSGDYPNAEKAFQNLNKKEPKSSSHISKLAVCFAKNGKQKNADDLIKTLKTLREAYQYGSVDYSYAQYYASIDNKDETMRYLRQSIADGNLYKPTVFQNDIHFQNYKDLPEFQRILKFWQN